MRRIGGILVLVLLAALLASCEPSDRGEQSAAQQAPTTEIPARSSTTVAPSAPRVTPTTVPVSATGGCHPSYAGACIPLGGDVDCGEISAKRFRVVGPDVYRLDADNDGVACES